jgi:hypothetical protein
MLIRARPNAQARMPSMRQPALNPRAPSAAVSRLATSGSALPAATLADVATAAGGFHESSYELQHGLNITESAWPDDVTIPGRLGES